MSVQEMEQVGGGGPGDDGPPGDRPRRSPGRALLLRLHFFVGVFVGPFILIAALTGFAYVLTPWIETAVYDQELTAPSGEEPQPLADQIVAARAIQPDAELVAIRPAPEPGATTRVMFAFDDAGPSETLAVFVDPGSLEVRGEQVVYGSGGALPIRTAVSHLHRHLMLGETGRIYSELAASWVGVTAVAGLALWFTGRRPGSRWRRTRTGGPRRRLLSLHGVAGTYLLVGILMVSATGLTWSTYAGGTITDLRSAAGWSTPALDVSGGEHAEHGGDEGGGDDAGEDHGSEHGDHGGEHSGHGTTDGTTDGANGAAVVDHGDGWDRAVEVAAAASVTERTQVVPPSDDAPLWTVTEIQRSWPTAVDAVAIDADGTVVDEVRFAEFGLIPKLARWGIDLHMGVMFGLPNAIAMAVLALGIAFLVVSGYRQWWLRRPRRGEAFAVGRAPLRGAWRGLSAGGKVGVGLGALAFGYAMPVLGVSLLVFLVVDAALARRGVSSDRTHG